MSYEVVRKTYFSYFHSVMSYGIIFWGNSSQNNSIFKIKKRTIRIIVNSSSRTSCHELFKELQIFTPHSECIYSSLMFVVKNIYLFNSNSVHNLSTRYNSDLDLPTANLTIFQKGVFHSGIKMYSNLSQSLKELSHDVRQFRLALKIILLKNAFYSLEEYLSCRSYD